MWGANYDLVEEPTHTALHPRNSPRSTLPALGRFASSSRGRLYQGVAAAVGAGFLEKALLPDRMGPRKEWEVTLDSLRWSRPGSKTWVEEHSGC